MRILLFTTLFLISASTCAQESLSEIYKKYQLSGSTTIYDYSKNKWFYTDSSDAFLGTLPASTFKILNSCIALEEMTVIDEYEILTWDGKEKTFFGTVIPSWNRDTSLKEAYQNSTVWFYERIAKQIGKTVYTRYLNEIGYGNGEIFNKKADFWNFGDFTVTPFDQIQFLIKLYEEELPFSVKTLSTVKNIMISDSSESYIMRDKTGWTKKDNKDIGWWVGYVEREHNVYFFATRLIQSLDNPNPNFSILRKKITLSILHELEAF